MTNKECFIYYLAELEKIAGFTCENPPATIEKQQREIFEKASKYFNDSIVNEKKSSVDITEKGYKILKFMQEKEELYHNCFKAKVIGEGIFCSGRAVSGSMMKLVNDGYCCKKGKDPVVYGLTDLGREKEIKLENN